MTYWRLSYSAIVSIPCQLHWVIELNIARSSGVARSSEGLVNVAWVVLHRKSPHWSYRERRQLIPHVRFQVPFLGPESQLKSGFACAGLLCIFPTQLQSVGRQFTPDELGLKDDKPPTQLSDEASCILWSTAIFGGHWLPQSNVAFVKLRCRLGCTSTNLLWRALDIWAASDAAATSCLLLLSCHLRRLILIAPLWGAATFDTQLCRTYSPWLASFVDSAHNLVLMTGRSRSERMLRDAVLLDV